MKNLQFTLAPLGVALALTACGGGGASSAGANNPSIPTAAIQITSSNANTVAGGSVAATNSTTAQGGSSAGNVVGVVTQGTGHLPSALSIATTKFKTALGLPLQATTVTGIVQTYTWDCTTGAQASPSASNTMTVSYSVAGSAFASGDSMTISYNSCADGTGSTWNGSMNYAVNSLTGTLGAAGSSASYTVTFNKVSDVSALGTVVLNGDMTVSASSSGVSPSITTTSTIAGSSFTMSDTVNSVTRSYVLTNYSMSYSSNASTTAFSYGANMTLAGTDLGGSVTVTTSTLFTGFDNQNSGNPTAGSMKISGSNGSYVTITANSNGTDATVSGTDGTTPFGPNTVSWSAL